MIAARFAMDFELVGRVASSSVETTFCWRTFCVSTSGDTPATVIVSSRDPTSRSAFTGAVNPAVSTMPSRLAVLNPERLKVTT
jgi:hypothetical protein